MYLVLQSLSCYAFFCTLEVHVLHVVGWVLSSLVSCLLYGCLEKFEESLKCLQEILVQHTYWAAGHLFLSSYLYDAPARWSLTLTQNKSYSGGWLCKMNRGLELEPSGYSSEARNSPLHMSFFTLFACNDNLGSQQGIFCMRSSNQTAKIFCSFCFYLFICKSVLCNSLGQ